MKFFKVAALCLVFVCIGAWAAGWSSSLTVTEIYPAPSYNGILIKQSSMINPDSCASAAYYLLKKDNVLFNEIYTLLVSAQARKSNVRIHVSGCTGVNDTDNTYPEINQVIAF